MNGLAGKVAVVTGASKGIGRGIATALAEAGAHVALNYSSDKQGAERAAQAIVDGGGTAIAVGGDVSSAADVARLYDRVDRELGTLDVLVNNAGILAAKTPLGRLGRVTDIAPLAVFLASNDSAWITGEIIRAAGGLMAP